MENQEKEEKKSGINLFMILSFVLLLVSGFLGYKLFTTQQEVIIKTVEVEKKNTEYDLAQKDLVELKEKLDGVQTDNKQMQGQLDLEREKIVELEASIEKYKGNVAALGKVRRELDTIRGLIKSYLRQIDSLNTANQTLQAENAVVRKDLDNEKGVSKQLTAEKSALHEKIEIGAKLKAYAIKAEALKEKSNNKEVVVTKAKKANKIKCCFTIAENAISKAGERIVYMKITAPDNHVFANGTDESSMFTIGGQKQPFSAKKTIQYENKSIESCLSFKKAEEFIEGKYKIEIFCEEALIASTSIDLK